MGEFTIDDIEKVNVNGMVMFKLGKELFLTEREAIQEVVTLAMPCKQNFDVVGIICKNGSIYGVLC